MNKIILAIGLVLGMAQFSHAGEKTIAWDKVDQVREQQVVSEVKRQIKNENSEIAKAIEDADSQNHGIENVKVIEIGSYSTGRTPSFEEKDFLAIIQLQSVRYCMGGCNELTTRSVIAHCHLKAEFNWSVSAKVVCKVKETFQPEE